MKPTQNFLQCLNRFVSDDRLTFAEEMKEAVELPEGTKLAKLVQDFRPIVASARLWLVVINQPSSTDAGLSDDVFPYDVVTSCITDFLKKLFPSKNDESLILKKTTESHSLSAVVSFHEHDTITGYKVLSTVLFQELDELQGYYIPYLGTAGDKFQLRGKYGDNRPWRRRGLTSLLLQILQAICQMRCNVTSLYLECRESLVPTYTKFGFCRCHSVDKSWEVPESMSLETSCDLVRMWNGTRVVTKAAISGTALIHRNCPFRSCCRDVAFRRVAANTLFELDVFIFEFFDCFEHNDSTYISRCSMCGDLSAAFSAQHFSTRFYEYASHHLSRCVTLRRDIKKRSMVEHLLKEPALVTCRSSNSNQESRIKSRSDWLSAYSIAIADSSCIPGCGIPYAESPKRSRGLLMTLPQRYSLRIAQKPSPSCTAPISTSTSIITHLQYTSDGRFVGYNINGTAFSVDHDYVAREFHDWFIYYVTSMSPRKFGIPDGASTCDKSRMCSNLPITHQAKRVVSQQLHRDTCVFSSALSAFKHIGDFKAVAIIRDRMLLSLERLDRLGYLVDLMANHYLKYQPVLFKFGKLDLLRDLSPFPTVVRLCGRDGYNSHVVTVVGRLVFDSNSADPLPLSAAALDWCCSYSNGERNQFACVARAYRFLQHKPKRHWILHI